MRRLVRCDINERRLSAVAPEKRSCYMRRQNEHGTLNIEIVAACRHFLSSSLAVVAGSGAAARG